MPNYQNGKIYAIRSPSTDKVYIGSTCDSSANRICGHRKDYRRFKAGKFNNVSSFQLLEFKDEYIELVEACVCNNKDELTRREGEVIRATGNSVNKKVEGRTNQQYYQDNKVEIIAQRKEYNQANAVAIAAHQKVYHRENAAHLNQKHNCLCGGRYTTTNRLVHLRTSRHTQYLALPAAPVEPVAA